MSSTLLPTDLIGTLIIALALALCAVFVLVLLLAETVMERNRLRRRLRRIQAPAHPVAAPADKYAGPGTVTLKASPVVLPSPTQVMSTTGQRQICRSTLAPMTGLTDRVR